MMWSRRTAVAGVPHKPMAAALVLLLPLSLLWFVAWALSVLEIQQLLAVTMVQAILLAVYGWRSYRALLAPLLYLYFLVPVGAELVPALQQFTAHFAVSGAPARRSSRLLERRPY